MIKLNENSPLCINPNGEFYSSVGGLVSNTKTFVSLEYVENYLCIKFRCENNPFLKDNSFVNDNDTLFKQEVFEIFVAKASSAPINYLELEINPNNAIFLGKIFNPSGVGGESKILEMLDDELHLIRHSVSCGVDSWEGEIGIPLSLIDSVSDSSLCCEENNSKSYLKPFDIPSVNCSKEAQTELDTMYMINFYRVVLCDKQQSTNWVSSVENSEFLCYKSTLSPLKPNFHITRTMQKLLLD